MTHPPAEFDAFASNYDAGMGDPLKRLVGKSAETFLDHKADWLLRNLAPSGRLLDFGCGIGGFLRALQQRGAELELVGCDASAAMIDAARSRWNGGPAPTLHAVPPGPLPFADDEFDVVTVVSVFHHIGPLERPGVVNELLRVIRPGGVLVLFEHNPRNPVTRWLVRRAAIDANAVLLFPAESIGLLRGAGATRCRLDYILFFPPRFRRLWAAERFLSRVPLSGQYVAVGTKAE